MSNENDHMIALLKAENKRLWIALGLVVAQSAIFLILAITARLKN